MKGSKQVVGLSEQDLQEDEAARDVFQRQGVLSCRSRDYMVTYD